MTAPKFWSVLVWICPSLRSGSPIIEENSAQGLPLTQEWVPKIWDSSCMGLPLTQGWVRILFWILPVLRSGSLIIQESSGVDFRILKFVRVLLCTCPTQGWVP